MLKSTKLYTAIALLWLFHLSGMIGISLGYESWFMQKTSINLIVVLAIIIGIYNLLNLKALLVFIAVSVLGYTAEVLGVNFGWFFGDYAYGNNLGIKIFGVPVLIGFNWGILTLVSARIAYEINPETSLFWRSFIGALLMLILDFFMEASAPKFDFWEFNSAEVPLTNYSAWFGFAYLFNLIVNYFKIYGQFSIALNIYLVQLVFFIFFYVYL